MFEKHHCTLRISKEIQHLKIIMGIALNKRNRERLSGCKLYALVIALFSRQSIYKVEIQE